MGLQEYRVSDVETIKELIEKGSATRSTGTTGANEESSRSHAILQLAIKRSVDGSESKPPRVVGKLSFIDLAGSERGADTTDNDKQTRYDFDFDFNYESNTLTREICLTIKKHSPCQVYVNDSCITSIVLLVIMNMMVFT